MIRASEKDLQEALRRSEEGRTRLRAALTQARGEAEAELREVHKQLRAAEELLASAERFDHQSVSIERIEALRDHLEELARSHLNLGHNELNETRSALAEATRTLAAEQESNLRLRVELAARLAATTNSLPDASAASSSRLPPPLRSSISVIFGTGGDSARLQLLQQMQQSLQSAMIELSALSERNAELKAELVLARASADDGHVATDVAEMPARSVEAAAPSRRESSEVLRTVSAQLDALAAQRAQLLRGWADAAWQLRRASRVAVAMRCAADDASIMSGPCDEGGLGAHDPDEVATARQEAAENALRKAARQHASDLWREREATVLAVQRATVAEKALQAMRASSKPMTPRAAQRFSAPQQPQHPQPTGACRSLSLVEGQLCSNPGRSTATVGVQAALGPSDVTAEVAAPSDGSAPAEGRAREETLRAELATLEQMVATGGGGAGGLGVARLGAPCSPAAQASRQSATEAVLRHELLSAERAAEAHLRAARLARAEAEASRAAEARASAEARTVAEGARTRVVAAAASAREASVRATRLRLRLSFEQQMSRRQASLLQAGARAAIARGAAFALAWRSTLVSGHGDAARQSWGADGESSRSDGGLVNGVGVDDGVDGVVGEAVTRADQEELVAGIEEATWRADDQARRAAEAEEAARLAEARAAEAEAALAALRVASASEAAVESQPGAPRAQSHKRLEEALNQVRDPGLRAVQEELERVQRIAAADAAAAETAVGIEVTARRQAESALRAEQERASCAAAELEQTTTRLREAEREVKSAGQLAKRHEQQAEATHLAAETRIAELQRRETAQADLVRRLQQQLMVWEANPMSTQSHAASVPASTGPAAAAPGGSAGLEALRLELDNLKSELSHARSWADEAANAEARAQGEARSSLWQARAQADSLVNEAREALLKHQRSAQEELKRVSAQLASVQSQLDEERTRSLSRDHMHEQLLGALERERAAVRAAKQEGEATAGRLQLALASAEHRLRQLERPLIDGNTPPHHSYGVSRSESGTALVARRQAESSAEGAQQQAPALESVLQSLRQNARVPASEQSTAPAAAASLIDFGTAGPTVSEAQPWGSSLMPLSPPPSLTARARAPETRDLKGAGALVDLGWAAAEPTSPGVDPEMNRTSALPPTLAFRTRKVVSSPRPVQLAGRGSETRAATVGRSAALANLSSHGLAPGRRKNGWGSLKNAAGGGNYASPDAGASASGSDEEDAHDEGAPLSFSSHASVQPRERLFSMDRVRRLLNKAGVDFSPRFQEALGQRAGSAAAFRTPAPNSRQQRRLVVSQGGGGGSATNTARSAYTG